MSLTYGFYNSVNQDRKYDTTQMSKLFDGIINDGVFMSQGSALNVSATTGMGVSVGLGRAWFSHTWTLNDAILPLTLNASELVLHRIDMVDLEVNANDATRANTIKVIKGTPGSFPVAPVCIRTLLVNQYALATIYVTAGTTNITQANITNKIGTSECPFVTGILSTINIDMLIAQWGSEFNAYMASLQLVVDGWNGSFDSWFASHQAIVDGWDGSFNSWFATIQNILDSNAATNLLNLINAKANIYKGVTTPSNPTSADFWFKQV